MGDESAAFQSNDDRIPEDQKEKVRKIFEENNYYKNEI